MACSSDQIPDLPVGSFCRRVVGLFECDSALQNILIILYCLLSRPTMRGVSRSSLNAGRDAVDVDVPLTNGADRGRKRRVVLAPRRWCQVREGKLSRVTVAKEPEHRGERAHNP